MDGQKRVPTVAIQPVMEQDDRPREAVWPDLWEVSV